MSFVSKSVLQESNYSSIADAMLTPHALRQFLRRPGVADASFSTQVGKVIDCDVILFTAVSAVPVADAVRAYFKGIGARLPELQYIRADRASAHAYFDRQEHSRIEEEKARLAPFIASTTKVAIIEQFVMTGETMMLAETIVDVCTEPTATTRVPVYGNWYREALPDEVDLEQLTSVHADFMQRVGAIAADSVVYDVFE